VIDTVDRAHLHAHTAVKAARVVDHESYRVGPSLAGAIHVALLHLDGDAVVRADPHALQTRDAAVHVYRQQPAAAFGERALVLGVLARDLLLEEMLEGDPHPLQNSLS
jgi:hypothetical protein